MTIEIVTERSHRDTFPYSDIQAILFRGCQGIFSSKCTYVYNYIFLFHSYLNGRIWLHLDIVLCLTKRSGCG